MTAWNKAGTVRTAVTVVAAIGAIAMGCIDRPVKQEPPRLQSGVHEEIVNEGIDKVDLIMMIDNSNSMRDNQSNIMAQLGPMIQKLTQPPCRSMSNPTPHTCNAADPMDQPIYPPVADMHVGVVSSDLGTPGSSVPGCNDADHGDDGLLNPIRNGAALMQHEPWTSAPPTFGRPMDCTDPNEYPAFIAFESGAGDPNCVAPGCQQDATAFTHDFQCNAGLYVNGCGLESQLEAVYRALLIHNPSDAAGNNDPNANFLRENALLAIVELTDEEDGSVRNCNYANGQACNDALDVYNAASTNWSSMNLNLRFYLYQPGGAQDPTWPLERYIDPGNPAAGFLGLKPGHPERVLFAAITGVPLPNDGDGSNWLSADGTTINWDMLLGAPASDPNDFNHRNSTTSISTMSAEGPVSMQQANPDPNCQERTVPACRRQGSSFNATFCTTDQQYFAWPARRVIEVARRFDQAPLCNGGPCHNGLVTSICSTNYASAMQQIIDKITSRLTGRCLPRVLARTADSMNDWEVDCVVQEQLAPDAPDMCDSTHGRFDPPGMNGAAGTPTYVTDSSGMRHRVCQIQQVPVDMGTNRPDTVNTTPEQQHGWFYDTMPQSGGGMSCSQAITFTDGDSPGAGSTTTLECIQSVTGM